MSEHPEFVELYAAFSRKPSAGAEPIRTHVANCVPCRTKVRTFLADADFVMAELSDLVNHEPEASIDWNYDATQAEQHAIAQTFVHAPLDGSEEFSIDLDDGVPALSLALSKSPDKPRSAQKLRTMVPELRRILLPAAAAILFAVAAGVTGFRLGIGKATRPVPAPISALSPATQSTGPDLQALTADREALRQQLAERDANMAGLVQKIKDQRAEIDRLTQDQQKLAVAAQRDEVERQGLTSEKDALSAKLEGAQAALADTQENFSKVFVQSQDLTAAIKNRDATIRDQDQTIQKQKDLLANDRDIRDLITARNLYVAEVFDIDKYAEIKKPYARVFFTKEKSLIFYGYDLDQQPEFRSASAFQAWGNRGHNRENALNLGLLYLDSAQNRRWALKLGDPETLKQIDAIFITLEPKGGSAKPTGKSVLFASLRLPPNHP